MLLIDQISSTLVSYHRWVITTAVSYAQYFSRIRITDCNGAGFKSTANAVNQVRGYDFNIAIFGVIYPSREAVAVAGAGKRQVADSVGHTAFAVGFAVGAIGVAPKAVIVTCAFKGSSH